LINGIGSMGGVLKKAATDVASNIKGAITGFLGIKSPSRVMKEVGMWTGRGLAIGIQSTVKENEAVMKDLGAVIAGVAKSNASEVASINKTASSEQSAIARKASADIAEIYAKARDAKRKLTAAEVR